MAPGNSVENSHYSDPPHISRHCALGRVLSTRADRGRRGPARPPASGALACAALRAPAADCRSLHCRSRSRRDVGRARGSSARPRRPPARGGRASIRRRGRRAAGGDGDPSAAPRPAQRRHEHRHRRHVLALGRTLCPVRAGRLLRTGPRRRLGLADHPRRAAALVRPSRGLPAVWQRLRGRRAGLARSGPCGRDHPSSAGASAPWWSRTTPSRCSAPQR
jgi:hypothetical protein